MSNRLMQHITVEESTSIKIKVSHSIIAVGVVGVRVP